MDERLREPPPESLYVRFARFIMRRPRRIPDYLEIARLETVLGISNEERTTPYHWTLIDHEPRM